MSRPTTQTPFEHSVIGVDIGKDGALAAYWTIDRLVSII